MGIAKETVACVASYGVRDFKWLLGLLTLTLPLCELVCCLLSQSIIEVQNCLINVLDKQTNIFHHRYAEDVPLAIVRVVVISARQLYSRRDCVLFRGRLLVRPGSDLVRNPGNASVTTVSPQLHSTRLLHTYVIGDSGNALYDHFAVLVELLTSEIIIRRQTSTTHRHSFTYSSICLTVASRH